MRRLGTDYIDLYYTHFGDKITPFEETLAAFDILIKAGKIRHIAASDISLRHLAQSFVICETIGMSKYIALKSHYNLAERSEYENEYMPLVENMG